VDQQRRSVVWDEDFGEQLARIIPEAIRADEFVAIAEEVLSIDPTLGTPADIATGIWLLPMAPVDNRQVTLYYTFDARAVVFLFISAGE
jgi:hypothetical protein